MFVSARFRETETRLYGTLSAASVHLTTRVMRRVIQGRPGFRFDRKAIMVTWGIPLLVITLVTSLIALSGVAEEFNVLATPILLISVILFVISMIFGISNRTLR